MNLVVDASTAMRWFFSDQRDALSIAALRYVRQHGAVVPCVWPIEVCHVIVKFERRGQLRVERSAEILGFLRQLPVRVESSGNEPAFPQLPLARRFELSAYDAAYLDLASRFGLQLATHDDKLAQAAAGLGLLWRPPASSPKTRKRGSTLKEGRR